VIHVATQRNATFTDAELLLKIADGDLGCLGLLFDRYEADVQGFVSRLGVASGEVDDLVQSTFLLVMRAAPNFKDFDGSGSARAWLLGLAANLTRRHRRSLARMAARVAAWAFERPGESEMDPAEALHAKEAAVRGQRALERLSPEKREVFVLVALEGVRGETAAATLGIPVGTLWTRLHRARRDLREYLLEETP
jgi:RNA polymerase sigma factor (sigma-70 family)